MTNSPRRKRTGSVLLTLTGLAFLIADSTDRLQKVVTFVPPRYSSYLPVAYGVLFIIALWLFDSAHKDDLEALKQPDLMALLEAQTNLGNKFARIESQTARRSLDERQRRIIKQALTDGLANHWKQFPPEAKEPPAGFRFRVEVVSVGRERETLDYRAEFENVLTDSGFYVETSEWEPGPPQLEPFTGTLTLLHASDPNNQVRAIVADALVAAGLSFREAPRPGIHRPPPRSDHTYLTFNLNVTSYTIVAELIIGQRG